MQSFLHTISKNNIELVLQLYIITQIYSNKINEIAPPPGYDSVRFSGQSCEVHLTFQSVWRKKNALDQSL